jgi:aspartate/methionine/tyrosine aminotransferase
MSLKVANRMSQLGTESAFNVLAEVRRRQAQGQEIVDLSIGDPDFDTPEVVKEAAFVAIRANETHYAPSAGLLAVRETVAAHLSATRGIPVSADEVVVTPGAKPLLFYGIVACVDPGDEVIYPNPGFPTYESVIRFVGGVPVPMPLWEERDFRPDLDELRRLVTPRTRMIILNSPNNPTGGVLSRSDLESIAEMAIANDCWVLADEIYSSLLYDDTHHSIAALPGLRRRTILLDGHSKSFAMTGWRLGYAALPAVLVEPIVRLIINSVSCTATFVQHAGRTALLEAQDATRAMRETFRQRRELVVAGLNAIPGIRCRPPGGAFYAFANVTEACRRLGLPDADALQRHLLDVGRVAVLSRSCFGPPNRGEAEQYLRLSFAASTEVLREGLERIRSVVTD